MNEATLEAMLFALIAVLVVVNVAISIYGILLAPSLVKRLIALVILGDSANMVAILVGYRLAEPLARPPIIVESPLGEPAPPSRVLVDPVPQALVLTAIVIGLAIYLVIASLILIAYRLYGTTDVRKISRLRG